MRTGGSLSFRLVGAATVWLVLLLAIGGGVLALAFRSAVEEEFGHRLDAVLRTIVASVEVAADGSLTMARPLGDPRFERIFSGWYWQIVGPDGRLLRSRSLWDSVLPAAPGGSDRQVRRLEGPRGEPLLAVERDLQFPGGPGPTHLLVAGELAEVSGGVRRFDLLLAAALGLLGVGMIGAIVLQVRYGLRPLRAMAADLAAVHAGDAPRMAGVYAREVAPLVEAMNGVLDRDADLIDRARSHVGNLAHGLKTALAVLSAELQGAADKAAMREQVATLGRLVEHHLGRAAALAGTGRLPGVRTAVRPLVDSLTAALARIHAERGLAFAIDVPSELAFRGHREDLEEILGNLLDNACKWARRTVRLVARDAAGGLRLEIEDDGPGLPPDRLAEAVRRGRRLDEATPGWGLGLSIVADLVDVNGGRLDLGPSSLGGLRVVIALPPP